jgi:hypothetical protein
VLELDAGLHPKLIRRMVERWRHRLRLDDTRLWLRRPEGDVAHGGNEASDDGQCAMEDNDATTRLSAWY